MLQVIAPLTLVPVTIFMKVDSLAVSLVVHPVTLISITTAMRELSVAMGPVIFPVAFVASAVSPNLRALPVSEPSDPLACVFRPSHVRVRLLHNSFRMRIIWLV